MFKKLLNKKLLKNQKGLTLIELLAVIVILAIVAAIAIPAIGNIIDNSRYNAVKADAINVLNAAQLYYTDNPGGESDDKGDAGAVTTISITVAQLQHAKYLESRGKISETASVTSGKPHELDGDSEQKVNGQEVKFEKATINDINEDKDKGSKLSTTKTIKPKS
ncbi:prepilin-type N-terminal cleavage/methylation domain-containing protein [Lysinibacillus sp. NPDC093712]|uniref:prepilin-type N-terminal cleavage/methylation domain-containing protein n=1 Tax=Lysinibacillus sp. NPDC093712 TaxID=3390579 RepID=UPI003D04F50F